MRHLEGDETEVRGLFSRALLVGIGLSLAVAGSILWSHKVHAANRGALNAAEVEARGMCVTQSRGAIWFSNDPNFYSMGATADAAANSVTVYLRGSSNTCVDASNAGKSSYAIHISSSGRLSIPPGQALNRGTWPSAHQDYNWTSQGNNVTATLDITGIASGTTVYVSLFRCPSFDGVNVAGPLTGCYASDVPIQVFRRPPDWNVTGWSTVSAATATPGTTVTFNHYIRNPGTAGTGADIWTDTIARDPNGVQSTVTPGHTEGPLSGGQTRQVDTKQFTIPLSASPGQQFCQRVGYAPSGGTNAGYSAGGWACVTVVLSYNINPFIDPLPSAIGPGGIISVTAKARNTGSTPTNNTYWTVRSFTVGAGPLPAALQVGRDDNAADICTVYASFGAVGCAPLGTGAPFTLTSGETKTVYTNNSVTIPLSATPGTWYCYVFSIDPFNQNPQPNKRHSVPRCTLVAAIPYLSVVGGDAWAGGSISSPYTGLAGFRGSLAGSFGSFGDYGIFATDTVGNFGSSGKIGTNPLTFANNATPLGRFTTTHKIYSPTSTYTANNGPVPTSGDISTSGVFPNSTTSTVTLGALTVKTGVHAVIYVPNGRVDITGPITYEVGGATFKDQPSLVIAAREIRIHGSVARVDGYMYAKNIFESCEQGPDTSASPSTSAITSTGACNKQLIINGALTLESSTGKAIFNRSFGGASTGNPAEMIRMRPEVFLTPYEVNYASGSNSYRTVSEIELPPRY